MGIFGGPCKHLVNYDGENWDLSGFSGPDKVNVKIGELKGKKEVLQTAAEITQLYDSLQFGNCLKIEQLPKNSPERITLTYAALQSEQQIVKLALLVKLMTIQPNNEKLTQAIVDWIAAQSNRLSQVPVAPKARDLVSKKPNIEQVRSSIKKAALVEPSLKKALAKPTEFDLGDYLS